MKKILALLVSLSILLTGLSGIVFTSYAAGEGTEENPYIITTEAELANISQTNDCAGVWYELQADIVLSESFEPKIFYGNLRGAEKADGSKYKITLNMNRNADYSGIFKQIFGIISNIEVDGTVSGLKNTGSVAGYAAETAIVSDCINSATVIGGGSGTGGIVGYVKGATIENCVNASSVSVASSTIQYAGGIAGTVISAATIRGCINNGSVASDRAGGIIGYVNDTESVVTLCRNNGSVVSGVSGGAGGIVGYLTGGVISSSFNSGTVETPSMGGGICYSAKAGEIKDCFNAGKVTTGSNAGGGAIAGILASGNIKVTNCYNIGELTSNRWDRTTPIGDYTNSNAKLKSNCYYATHTRAYSEALVTADQEITTAQWAEMVTSKTLPDGFSSDVWEYVEVGTSNSYPLPQLKGNDYNDGEFALFELGSQYNPIKVGSAADFAAIASNPSAYYLQTADIEGITAGLSTVFTGNYDGNGKEIKVAITSTVNYASLFNEINGATVKNVVLDGTVNGAGYVGGIVGKATASRIEGCINKAAVTATGNGAAGVVGYVNNHTATPTIVTGCKNYGAVKGSRYIGGIVGYNYDKIKGGIVELCANYGRIEATTNGAAGITGYNGVATVSKCLNEGTVVAPTYAGGIIYQVAGVCVIENCINTGNMETGASGLAAGIVCSGFAGMTVNSCYNTGKLTGRAQYIFAVGGYNGIGTFTNCYYTTPATAYTTKVSGVTEIADTKWIELKASNALPEGFSQDAWEYVAGSEFKLPQLKGNACTISAYDLPEVNTTDFGGGFGTPESPFVIANETHFANIVKFPAASYIQTAALENITEPVKTVFTGSYNGNGLSITAAIDKETENKVALFSEAKNATIEKVVLNGFVKGNETVGGIVGYADTTVVKNCVNNAEIYSKAGRVGGIVGEIKNRYAELIGCVNNGKITADNSFAGGVVGVLNNNVTVNALSNYGYVEGKTSTGGVVGIAYSDISNCLNAGTVIGNNYVGGVIGQIRASYGENGSTNLLNLGRVMAYGEHVSAFGKSNHTDYPIEFTNCINAGDVGNGNTAENLAAGGKTCTLTNCYYLTIDENAVSEGTVYAVKSLEELKALTLDGFGKDANGYPSITANPAKAPSEFFVLEVVKAGENGSINLPSGKRYAHKGNNYLLSVSAVEGFKGTLTVNEAVILENVRDGIACDLIIDGDMVVKYEISEYIATVPEVRSLGRAYTANERFYDPIGRKTFDKYAAVAAVVYEAENYEVKEYGFAISSEASEPTVENIRCVAANKLENGRFAVVIAGAGLASEQEYYARPYVTYSNGEEVVTVYGNVLTFTIPVVAE